MSAKNQSLRQEVTLEKLQRDASKIRQYARFVIVLGKSQLEVIDNGYLRKGGLPYAKLIAVLGPVEYKGVSLQESVLMEIGYSRTRPYTQIEKGGTREKKDGKNGFRIYPSWSIKSRKRARLLLGKELVSAYPHIVRCIETIVLEQREGWKVKGRWWVDGPGAIERGIHFSVSHDDQLLWRQLILEDVWCREKKYIAGHAKRIRRMFREYKYSHYTLTQVRKFVVAGRIVELLSQPHYTPFYRAILARHFKPGSHLRSLFELVAQAFHIDIDLDEQETVILGTSATVLPRLAHLRCYRPPGQPLVQARGSSVFEITLERSYGEKNEIPF